MRSTAKHIGRIGALAVALGVGAAAAATPVSAETKQATALILCGASCPTPDDTWVKTVMNQFVVPTHPGYTFDELIKVTAPGEIWPITGAGRLIGLALGDSDVFGLDGPAWPDAPLWKLSGLFDLSANQSVEIGADNLEAEIARHQGEPLVIYAYSQGAGVANVVKRRLAEQYPKGTTPPDITFVLGGDPNLPNGGLMSRFSGLYIPILDFPFNGPAATNTPFKTVEINRQFDGFTDFPLYPLNAVADLNAILGIVYVHMYGFDVSLPAKDPETSPAYQGTHGDTTYYFFENPDLPLFGPLRTLGGPEKYIDVVEPFFRVIVEAGYDRDIKPWEPTPARLIPTNVDPVKVTKDLVDAVGEGVDNARALVADPGEPAGASTTKEIRSRTPLKDILRDFGNRLTRPDTAKDRDVMHPAVSKTDRKTPLRDAGTAIRSEVKKLAIKVTDRIRHVLGAKDDKTDRAENDSNI